MSPSTGALVRALGLGGIATAGLLLASTPSFAATDGRAEAAARHAAVVAHWTPERRAAATPRDLRIDPRGLAYLRKGDGRLVPYGHGIPLADARPVPQAKPGGGGDTTPPSIGNLSPAAGSTVGASVTFSATVSDNSGLRSVSFTITSPSGTKQSFNPSAGANNTWSVTLNGFTDGAWKWQVIAKDTAGLTSTSALTGFTVSTSGGGGGGTTPGTVTNEAWVTPGTLQTAAGRIYFEMPTNAKRTRWAGYVCSGTVVNDSASGRSLILTAAHCVYDDANKAFARNVIFIPNQDETQGTGTDRDCTNDPLGCWTTNFGVVDKEWTTRTFPANIPWDYAFYVVSDTGARTAGVNGDASPILDAATGTVNIRFAAPTVGAEGHALGYSYSDDPNFMYCKEPLANLDSANWWLGSCGLSGGSSGGPWIQPMQSSGTGEQFSVNSWGYTDQPGMAGPKLNGTSASCLLNRAIVTALFPATTTAGNAGIAVDPGTCP